VLRSERMHQARSATHLPTHPSPLSLLSSIPPPLVPLPSLPPLAKLRHKHHTTTKSSRTDGQFRRRPSRCPHRCIIACVREESLDHEEGHGSPQRALGQVVGDEVKLLHLLHEAPPLTAAAAAGGHDGRWKEESWGMTRGSVRAEGTRSAKAFFLCPGACVCGGGDGGAEVRSAVSRCDWL